MTVKHEIAYPEHGGTFNLDVAFFDENNQCHLVVLAKALNSSVRKNIKNYGNTTIGEATFDVFIYPPKEILFITVSPRLAPRFDKHGNVTGFDDVVKAIQETNPQKVLDKQYDNVCASYIFYDIVDVKT